MRRTATGNQSRDFIQTTKGISQVVKALRLGNDFLIPLDD
jgi:hypothetical protein